MNATFSRQLAELVQEPPPGLDPMSVIQIREDLVRATDRGADQFADLPEDLQEQLRQWPSYPEAFGQVEMSEAGRGMEDYPPMEWELLDVVPSPEALALMVDPDESPESQ